MDQRQSAHVRNPHGSQRRLARNRPEGGSLDLQGVQEGNVYDREIGYVIDSWVVPQYIRACRDRRFKWKPVWQAAGWFVMIGITLIALEAWGR